VRDRRKNTAFPPASASEKPSAARQWIYALSKDEVSDPERCEEFCEELKADGACNLRVFKGEWSLSPSGPKADKQSELLCTHATPGELRTWLSTRAKGLDTPILIEADLPPIGRSEHRARNDAWEIYWERLKKLCQTPMGEIDVKAGRYVPPPDLDTMLAMRSGEEGQYVKELYEIEEKLRGNWSRRSESALELNRKREELFQILLKDYPETASELGLDRLRTGGDKAQGSLAQDSDETPALEISAASWQEIEIAFLSDERVEISSGGNRKTYNYSELGFEDRRNEKPNRAWIMLRELASSGGSIHARSEIGKKRAMVQKRIEEIREKLRGYFKIESDPIPLNGNTYHASFKISRRRSVDS
jgi:hypothetical protein